MSGTFLDIRSVNGLDASHDRDLIRRVDDPLSITDDLSGCMQTGRIESGRDPKIAAPLVKHHHLLFDRRDL